MTFTISNGIHDLFDKDFVFVVCLKIALKQMYKLFKMAAL